MHLIEQEFNKLKNEINNSSSITGIPSGFSVLDNTTSGFQNGQVTIIAARPGMGKQSFALNIVHYLATQTNERIAIFSLREIAKQLAKNIFRINRVYNAYSPQDIDEKIVKAPVYFDDPDTISILELMERASVLKHNENISLIIIDYLQLISGFEENNGKKNFEKVMRLLKILAQSLNIPIIVLSQLHRDLEYRKDKKPRLNDLDNYGLIQKYVDVVLFLYRWDYYKINEDDSYEDVKDKALVRVAKNRNGYYGDVVLNFDFRSSRFSNNEY